MAVIPDFNYELSLLPPGTRYLLGIDEVGRGPLAGPVTLGAFLLDLIAFDPAYFIKLQVRDSKLLSPAQRRTIFSEFQKQKQIFSVHSLDSKVVDQMGIGAAIKKLAGEVINEFDGRFDFCIFDGNVSLGHSNTLSVVGADKSCFSVAAASVVAKVARDQIMSDYDQLYPGYGFASNMGYGTAAHLTGLQKLGPCPIHRFSYKPIKNILDHNFNSFK